MTEFLPGPDTATPYPGSPPFFKRYYNTLNVPLVQSPLDGAQHGAETIITPQMAIMIYGYSCRSPYPEDSAAEAIAWDRSKAFPSVCFSEVEPEGEYGFTPMSQVLEISREEFDKARERGWR
jgi:hypothetical protein